MNYIDALIIVLLMVEIIRGAEVGLFRQFFSVAGFWTGFALGGALAPLLLARVDAASKFWLVLVVVFGSAMIIGALGEWLGQFLAGLAHRLRLTAVDRALGGVLGAVMVVVVIWLGSGMLANTQSALSREIHRSRIVRWIDGRLPSAPPYLAKIQRLLTPDGFPQVFIGLEPTPSEPVNPASSADVAQALQAAAASVVKIESVGCGGIIDGSGFVANPGIVVTNAHVVAGITKPGVVDKNGRHTAETIYFNPDLDIAVLRTNGLAGSALPIFPDTVKRGTQAVALGYPGGGPLTGVPAGVLSQYMATGRNIYDQGVVTRSVYELQADIRQGNSGGPLVRPDGTVIGVIFAKSQNSNNIGYSLTSSEVLPKVRQAESSNQAVSTGQCLAE